MANWTGSCGCLKDGPGGRGVSRTFGDFHQKPGRVFGAATSGQAVAAREMIVGRQLQGGANPNASGQIGDAGQREVGPAAQPTRNPRSATPYPPREFSLGQAMGAPR